MQSVKREYHFTYIFTVHKLLHVCDSCLTKITFEYTDFLYNSVRKTNYWRPLQCLYLVPSHYEYFMNTSKMAVHMSQLKCHTNTPLTILMPNNPLISAQSTISQTNDFHFHTVAYNCHFIYLM